MKRIIFCLCLASSLALPLEARINVFDPWLPGQDLGVVPLNTYQPVVSFLRGDALTEVPVSFSYGALKNLEVGGHWGVRSYAGNSGITDLLVGAKYVFLFRNNEQIPQIAGEAALLLPTADSKSGLGTGNVGLLLHWALEKQIQEVLGSFGIGVQLNSETSDNDKQGNVFFFHIGGEYPYSDEWNFYGELKGYNHSSSKIHDVEVRSSYQELYLAPGADFMYSNKFKFSGAVLFGLTPDSQRLGLMLSVTFK